MSRPSSLWTVGGRRLLLGTALVGSVVASYSAVGLWQARREHASTPSSAATHGATSPAPVNPFAAANGTHLIAFVVTASDCGWSQQPEVMAVIRRLRATMRAVHGSSYAQVSVVGVALDQDLDAGLRFLSDLADGKLGAGFDQVVVGGSWLNEEVVRLVWRAGVAQAASPQILVVERPVNTESYELTSTIGIEDDRLVAQPTGSAEIVQWITQRVPLNATPVVLPPGHHVR